jgi:hypothetical protein
MDVREYHSPKDYLDAAKSSDTTVEELQYLAFSEYNFVRLAVAQNPNTTSEILASLVPKDLSSWPDQELAHALAKTPGTTADTMRALIELVPESLNKGRANDMLVTAVTKVVSHINTPIDAIESLLNSDKISTQVLRIIARQIDRTDILNILSTHRSEAVRKRAEARLKSIG